MKKRKASGTRRRRGLEEMKKRRETEERRRILAEKEARKLAEERRARKAAEEAERQRAEAARQAEAEARARAETEEARLFAEERRIEKARAEEARREAVRKREAKRTDRESRQAEREAKRAAREAKKAERTAKQANRETKRTDRKAAKADRKDGGKRKDSKAKAAASRSSKIQYAILGFVFAVGFCLMAYPTFSDYWNSFTQSRAIMSYAESISGLSDEEYDALYQFAEDYNANIVNRQNIFMPSEEEKVVYNEALNLGGNGIMGYINIPVIDQTIPIYHGTTESVLQVAVGHLEWTSLPVGGPGTHCVLSGHRGLPSARLFTDLDKVVVGDTFTLNILDEILTYEVDQILIVLPEEIGPLKIVPGEDYCTLVTCTPYGINTHRILCRGKRIENAKQASNVRVTADASQIESVYVAPVVALPLLVLIISILFAQDKSHAKEEKQYSGEFDWDAVIRGLSNDWGFGGGTDRYDDG